MYFRNFPKTLYSFDLSGSSATSVTNIFSRFSFNNSVLNNALAYYKYQIVDGDTPETVAYKQYGDPLMHWVICMTNNLSDPIFELPLSQDALERKIIKQYSYSSIANAYSEIHHYELEVKKVLSEVDGPTTVTTNTSIVTLEQYNYTSNTIQTKPTGTSNSETKTVTFYANNSNANSAIVATLTMTSTYKPVYVYDYENELNESKREIKILKQQYIGPLILELETVLNG
jgi:hypothetical protein